MITDIQDRPMIGTKIMDLANPGRKPIAVKRNTSVFKSMMDTGVLVNIGTTNTSSEDILPKIYLYFTLPYSRNN